jgi:hypothetical protein
MPFPQIPKRYSGPVIIIGGVISTILAQEFSKYVSEFEVDLKTTAVTDPDMLGTIKDKTSTMKTYSICVLLFEAFCVAGAINSCIATFRESNKSMTSKFCGALSLLLNITTFGISCYMVSASMETIDDVVAFAEYGKSQGAITGRRLQSAPTSCEDVEAIIAVSGRRLQSSSMTLDQILTCLFNIIRDSGGKEAATALFFVNMGDLVLEYLSLVVEVQESNQEGNALDKQITKSSATV